MGKFIGGVTIHRDQFYCKNCGHIQWAVFTEYGSDHIMCEVCNCDHMVSKLYITKRLWMKGIIPEVEITKMKLILHEMELRE